MTTTWHRFCVGFYYYLLFIGVTSALGKYLLPQDVHLWLAALLGDSYAQHLPLLAEHSTDNVHRSVGALYLILGMLQFMPAIRKHHPKLHRWCGRLFLILSVLAGMTGVLLSLIVSFGGSPEAIPAVVFATAAVVCAIRAYLFARARRFREHREWMIRTFAFGLGVSVIRLWFWAFVFMAPGMPHTISLVAAFWLGWISSLLGAEYWIRHTRRPLSTHLAASVGFVELAQQGAPADGLASRARR